MDHKHIVFKTPSDGHYFSGYYDKSPLDSQCKKMLAMKVDFIDRLPESHDEAQIGFFDLDSGNFERLTYTNSFNWQQGAMLQWVGPDYNERIAFNRRMPAGFKGIIYHIASRTEKELAGPIYVIDPHGKYALSIDFERHYWCRRGYSYSGIEKPEKHQPIVKGDGIWRIDLESCETDQVIRLESLLSIKPLASMKSATHYVEHMMFAPDGKRFSFYHRWKPSEGGLYTRLYVVNSDGTDIKLVHDTGRLSHHCWTDNSTILAIGSEKTSLASGLRRHKLLARLAKPMLPLYRYLVKGNSVSGQTLASRILTGDTYFLVNVDKSSTKSLFRQSLDRDGHPTAIPGQTSWIVTDTYPDASSKAQLLVADLQSEFVITLDTLNSISQFDNSPMRCDLHPKVSYNGRYIAIDTMNDGVRGIYVYALPDLTSFSSIHA